MKVDTDLEKLLKKDLIRLVKDLVEDNKKLNEEIKELHQECIIRWEKENEYKREIEELREENLRYFEELHNIRMNLYAPNYKRTGRKNKFNEEQIQHIKEARAEGKSIRAIADQFNCSVGLVHKLIKEE